jgi:hypothetical protein
VLSRTIAKPKSYQNVLKIEPAKLRKLQKEKPLTTLTGRVIYTSEILVLDTVSTISSALPLEAQGFNPF